MQRLFLPWKQEREGLFFAEKKIYTPKGKAEFLQDTDGIRRVKPPFFSIPSAKGIISLFLDAVQKDAEDEARAYISRRLWHSVDMAELRGLFGEIEQYQCFFGQREKGIHTLYLTIQEKSGKTNVFAIAMVDEKNAFGQWKIFQIAKE